MADQTLSGRLRGRVRWWLFIRALALTDRLSEHKITVELAEAGRHYRGRWPW